MLLMHLVKWVTVIACIVQVGLCGSPVILSAIRARCQKELTGLTIS